jgi:DNA-binding response OmpR family regulator
VHEISTRRRPRILIIEDEAAVGLALAGVLADEGFGVVGPVGSRREALLALEDRQPHAAVLDLSLEDGFCIGLTRELRARATPFLVYSGLHRDSVKAPELEDVPWIEKPGRAGEMIRAVSEMVAA